MPIEVTSRGHGDSDSFAASLDAFHEAAADTVSYDDFGDPHYLEGLRILLDAYDAEARLHPHGRELVRGMIVHTLTQRLLSERQWKEHPEVLETHIPCPIIILGCVRTGSTALHYLMGADPALQKLEWWLAANPRPRPPRDEWESHPEFQASQAEMDAMFAENPSLEAMHHTAASGPEECRHFLAQSFTDDAFEVTATVPGYEDWYHTTRHERTYERHKKLVQLVGATDLERRWLLKYPVHLRQLDVLLAAYPDACVVHTHRRPTEVIPSYTNMVASYRALFEDDIDRADIARRQLAGWADAANRAVEVRERHAAARFFDVYYDDFMADRVGCVRQIYACFGQPFSAETEAALERHVAANPPGRFGVHEYSARGTGLSEGEIREAFGPYLARFYPDEVS